MPVKKLLRLIPRKMHSMSKQVLGYVNFILQSVLQMGEWHTSPKCKNRFRIMTKVIKASKY